MKRRDFIKFSMFLSAGSFVGRTFAGEKDLKPNFIFFLADDLGWGDLGCYGHPKVKTPNIDRLARQGTSFTSFYVNSPVCSPTRAGIMTGQFPSRHGFHTQIFGNPRRVKEMKIAEYLDPDVVLLPRILKRAGYETAHIGKWHLAFHGGTSPPRPEQYGIDFSRTIEFDKDKIGTGWKEHRSSECFADQALEFLKQRDKEKPFLMQLWFNDPHNPYYPTNEHLKAYPKMPANDKMTKYWAIITEMDKQIGRILDKVEQDGISRNTYIIFSSDNGPGDPSDLSANEIAALGSAGPFRGTKGSLYEGGVRTPFIVACPGKVPAGRIDEKTQISGVDLLPTFCSLAQASLPENYKSDGQDMSEAFAGKVQQRSKPLMWFYPIRYRAATINQSPVLSILDGDWKLLTNPNDSRTELFKLDTDLTETDNLVNQYPDVTKRLKSQLLNWYRSLPANTIEPGAGELTFPWPGEKWDAVTESLDN
ncbi:Arylsulfatase [Limihaloglobus sulfuriphilus]|uniref:Arylsulfatase n=1 Tax=Limihaloglobus sulfuriphilus TaxID=1851148 RepID=A0A1Q2MFE7_9BACT|nr:sulfatase-like hydrolase/transferase [Limihaloglobus sulfuriphilus]AQQ71017.1 Arylsulfatase [Limihaloglobus sulfuriphilus]